jgi:hypothetical protein
MGVDEARILRTEPSTDIKYWSNWNSDEDEEDKHCKICTLPVAQFSSLTLTISFSSSSSGEFRCMSCFRRWSNPSNSSFVTVLRTARAFIPAKRHLSKRQLLHFSPFK